MGELEKLDDVVALAERAKQGDRAALDSLKEKAPEYLAELGNLTLIVREKILGCLKFSPGDRFYRASVEEKLKALERELAGPSPSPLELLLVERIVTCWLNVQEADLRYEKVGKDGCSLVQGDYYQRRQDRAHRRLMSAARTLAQVRKLGGAVVQVNIGEQQVNVTGHPM